MSRPNLPAVLFVLALGAPRAAQAECEDAGRATQLAASLARQRGRARTWRFGWTGVNGALALGSVALLPVTRRSEWPDLIVGGAASALSAVVMVLTPLDVEADARAAMRLAPCGPLERIDALASHAAADERARVSWPWHLLNLGVAVVVGGILVVGFDHWEAGALNGGATFVLGELQLFTQPTP